MSFIQAPGIFSVFLKSVTQNPGRGITVAGPVETPCAGEKVTMWGCWQKHPRLACSSVQSACREKNLTNQKESRNFYGSGMIDGIGPA